MDSDTIDALVWRVREWLDTPDYHATTVDVLVDIVDASLPDTRALAMLVEGARHRKHCFNAARLLARRIRQRTGGPIPGLLAVFEVDVSDGIIKRPRKAGTRRIPQQFALCMAVGLVSIATGGTLLIHRRDGTARGVHADPSKSCIDVVAAAANYSYSTVLAAWHDYKPLFEPRMVSSTPDKKITPQPLITRG